MNENVRISGAAFNRNKFKGNRIKSSLNNRNKTYYISLTKWCNGNFISKDIGRNLLKKKLLIGQKYKGQWWVCTDENCKEFLLDYLGLEQLYLDILN